MRFTINEHITGLEHLYILLTTDSDLATVLAAPQYALQAAKLALLLHSAGSQVVSPAAIEKSQIIVDEWNLSNLHQAPLNKEMRDQLLRDSADILGAAARHGDDLTAVDVATEQRMAQEHFELGCWLFFHRNRRISNPDGVWSRIDCLRRIIQSGISNPGYSFHSVFRFGERDFDTLFEMGDSAQVIHALRPMAKAHPDEVFGRFFKEHGWPLLLGTDPSPVISPSMTTALETCQVSLDGGQSWTSFGHDVRIAFRDADEDDDSMQDLLLTATREGVILDLVDQQNGLVSKTASLPLDAIVGLTQ